MDDCIEIKEVSGQCELIFSLFRCTRKLQTYARLSTGKEGGGVIHYVYLCFAINNL